MAQNTKLVGWFFVIVCVITGCTGATSGKDGKNGKDGLNADCGDDDTCDVSADCPFDGMVCMGHKCVIPDPEPTDNGPNYLCTPGALEDTNCRCDNGGRNGYQRCDADGMSVDAECIDCDPPSITVPEPEPEPTPEPEVVIVVPPDSNGDIGDLCDGDNGCNGNLICVNGCCAEPECTSGSFRECANGTGTEACSNGRWSGVCNIDDEPEPEPEPDNTLECVPGTIRTCGSDGTQTCVGDGSGWTTCIQNPTTECTPGQTRSCDNGTQTCSSVGAWGGCIITTIPNPNPGDQVRFMCELPPEPDPVRVVFRVNSESGTWLPSMSGDPDEDCSWGSSSSSSESSTLDQREFECSFGVPFGEGFFVETDFEYPVGTKLPNGNNEIWVVRELTGSDVPSECQALQNENEQRLCAMVWYGECFISFPDQSYRQVTMSDVILPRDGTDGGQLLFYMPN